MMYVQVFVGIMKTGKEVKFMKLISLYTHPCRIIVFTVMMPILITFVVMLTKYDGTLLVEDVKDLVCKVGHMIGVKNHQQTAEFTEFSIVWSSMSSITMALCWCKYSVTLLRLNDLQTLSFRCSSLSRCLLADKNWTNATNT